MGPRFFLGTLPTVIAMAFGTAMGWVAGQRMTGVGTAAAVVGVLLCLVAAFTFRAAGWAPALLIGFSAAAGTLIARLPALAGPSAARLPLAVSIVGLGAAALVGRALHRRLRPAYGLIWIAAWLAVLSAVVLQVTGFRAEWVPSAAKAVLGIFLALAAAWFAHLEAEPPTLAALDLYLIALNLFMATAVLLGPQV